MYPPPPQHDMPPVHHLLPFRQIWELEVYDHLQCMPATLAMHVAESFYWWIPGNQAGLAMVDISRSSIISILG